MIAIVPNNDSLEINNRVYGDWEVAPAIRQHQSNGTPPLVLVEVPNNG